MRVEKRFEGLNPEPFSFSVSLFPTSQFWLVWVGTCNLFIWVIQFLQHKNPFFSPFSPRRENEPGGRDEKRTSRDTFVVEYGLCGGVLVNCVVPHSFQSTTLSYDNTITIFCVFQDVFIHRRTHVGCVSLQISKMSDEWHNMMCKGWLGCLLCIFDVGRAYLMWELWTYDG